jgi:hypothetical protein
MPVDRRLWGKLTLTWYGGEEAELAQLELDVHVVVLEEGLVV